MGGAKPGAGLMRLRHGKGRHGCQGAKCEYRFRVIQAWWVVLNCNLVKEAQNARNCRANGVVA
jgi:hypothetical protein